MFGQFELLVQFFGPVKLDFWFEKVSEWIHLFRDKECVGSLVDKSVPSTSSGDVSWCGVVEDCIQKLLTWSDVGQGDFQSSKCHGVLAKLELLGIEGDAILCAGVQKLACLEECLTDCVSPRTGVIDTPDFGSVVDSDGVVPLVEGIPARKETHRSDTVPVSSPRGQGIPLATPNRPIDPFGGVGS